jgi:hypothetical protein
MLDLLVLAALLVAGLGCGRRLLRAVPFGWPLEEALAALALTLGLLAYVTLALGELGLLYAWAIVAVVAAAAWYGRREVLAAGALAVRGMRRWRDAGPSRSEVALLALGTLLVAATTVLDLAPPIGGDQTKYQLVYPRLYAEAHGLVDTPWSFWGYMQYLTNMLFAVGFVLRGDVLARLMHVAFGVLTVLAVFALGRRCFSRRVGVWAAGLFVSMPLSATLMSRAWVEFTLAAYVLLAVLALVAWWQTGARPWLALSAIMVGFAGGTKIMGLLAAGLLGAAVLVRVLQRDGAGALRPAVASMVGFGLVAGLVASPCYLRNAVATGNPIFPFGYGLFGGAHWSVEAATGLDDYYAAYREHQARKRDSGPYRSLAQTLRFPWDATMAPHSFEEVGRSTYDFGPFLLAFVPAVLLLRREPLAWLLTALAVGYGAVIVLGMWAHPRYVHPAFPLLLVVAVRGLDALRAYGAFASRLVTAVLALTVLGQAALSLRVIAPLWPDAARVVTGAMSEDAFLRRHESRYALWSLVNAEVPADGNVLVLGMIPHPYHLERRFTLASPLEQGAIDYRRLATLDDFVGVLTDLGVTHVVREPEREKPATNPVGPHVVRLWEELLKQCDKVAEGDAGTVYALRARARGQGPV